MTSQAVDCCRRACDSGLRRSPLSPAIRLCGHRVRTLGRGLQGSPQAVETVRAVTDPERVASRSVSRLAAFAANLASARGAGQRCWCSVNLTVTKGRPERQAVSGITEVSMPCRPGRSRGGMRPTLGPVLPARQAVKDVNQPIGTLSGGQRQFGHRPRRVLRSPGADPGRAHRGAGCEAVRCGARCGRGNAGQSHFRCLNTRKRVAAMTIMMVSEAKKPAS